MVDSISEAAGAGPNLKPARRKRTMASTRLDADRLPPHAPEAEQGILGCALLSPNVVMPVLEEKRFAGECFYDLRHQTIYAALQKRYASKDGAMDIIAVMQTLKDMGMLEQIGGIPYLNALQDGVPSAANLSYYLDLVREKWKLRNLIQFAADMVGRAYSYEGELDRLLDELSHDFLTFTEPLAERTEHHIKQVINEHVLPNIERHYSRGSTQLDGLPTGKDWYLDKILLGIANNDYVILAGRPGEGKTSLALNVVDYLATDYQWWRKMTPAEYEQAPEAARAGYTWQEARTETLDLDGEQRTFEYPEHWGKPEKGIPIGIFTLEMTEESLTARLVFSRAEISSGSFRQGYATKDAWNRVHKAIGELSKVNIYLDGEPDQTIDQIAAKARRWARQYGIKLFVLDYLQLLDGDDSRDNDRVRALRKISKKIVALKKRLGIPWLVLAQMNRNIETAERARRPVMSDLKESGSLEQDADKIVILYHPLKTEGIEEDEERIDAVMQAKFSPKPVPWDAVPRRINALVVKNRNGPTGAASMLFQNNQCLFQDWRRWCIEHKLVEPAAGERTTHDRQLDTSDYQNN